MERKNNILSAAAFLFVLFLFSAGCGSEYSIQRYDFESEYNKNIENSRGPADEGKEEEEKSISDIIHTKSNYRYSPVGKRDPFKSYFGDAQAVEREKEPVSELQKYNISDMRVNAIIWGIAAPRALVTAPDGKTFKLRNGDFIGKNWGKVNKILPDKIEIIETYKDPLGRKILNKLYLELPVESLKKQSDVFVDDGSESQ